MTLFLAMLAAAAAPSQTPEIEAVMGRHASAPERRAGAAPVNRAARIDPQLEACATQAATDPTAAIRTGEAWMARKDSPDARQCIGMGHAAAGQWTQARDAFAAGARLAGAGDPATAARLWAQAGNAALVSGDPAAARTALDRALAGGLVGKFAQGEAYLDRARALVAMKDETGARADLDTALQLVPEDPLAWLLSATLARRMDDLALARRHIAQAASLADDDASVALEQGVIAALSGDDNEARSAFARVGRLAPGTEIARNAESYLAQLPAATPANVPQSR
jgi:tetratricopeptide (TPR) repeat protein